MTNEQKKDWFLRLDPNGRIPILIDHNQSPPFPVMETSAELLYLLKVADKDDVFGFKDELERSQALQWLFFWHGSGAPYQGQVNHFAKFAKEKIPCMYTLPTYSFLILAVSIRLSLFFKKKKKNPLTLLPPYQTPSNASATKPSASTACSRSN